MAKDNGGRGEQTLSPQSPTSGTLTHTDTAHADSGGSHGSASRAKPGDPEPGIEAIATGSGFGHDDNAGVHPKTGKSLDYVRGAGFEAYPADQYESDQVNNLDHFNRY